MQTNNIFIAHPTTTDEIDALKAVVKALKIKFEIASKEKPYNEEFVNMVMEADAEIKSGKGRKLSSKQFDELWK
jgi:hypothetical protein